MKKITCLFQRDFTNRPPALLREVTPGCEWVLAGEGVATRKWDGTACLVRGGEIYARLDVRRGNTPPPGATPCEPEADPTTGHWPHWVKATRPEDKWHRETFAVSAPLADGTYELVGPKINGNAERLTRRALIRHGIDTLAVPRSWEGLRSFLAEAPIEGIVFHHPDGRMAKIRRDDYGFSWPVDETPPRRI